MCPTQSGTMMIAFRQWAAVHWLDSQQPKHGFQPTRLKLQQTIFSYGYQMNRWFRIWNQIRSSGSQTIPSALLVWRLYCQHHSRQPVKLKSAAVNAGRSKVRFIVSGLVVSDFEPIHEWHKWKPGAAGGTLCLSKSLEFTVCSKHLTYLFSVKRQTG